MKILHLARDDKFIRPARMLFENVFPGQNEFLIYSFSKGPFKYLPDSEFKRITNKDIANPFFAKKLGGYDCVILHALTPEWTTLINRAPKGTRFAWLGWGYDYYHYIYPEKTDIMLPETADLYRRLHAKKEKAGFLSRMNQALKKIAMPVDFQKAAQKITFFAPVLSMEHDAVSQADILHHVPPYISWNYGNLEQTLVGNFMGQKISGKNILIGNSASYENNHLEIFDLLSRTGAGQGRKLVCPLSYGDDAYKAGILARGKKYFDGSFMPLIDFMPIDDYIALTKSCGFTIMNHIRQQGLGNIITMLYLGSKVFLREECPSYRYFKNNGAVVYSVQELDDDPRLLDDILDDADVEKNRAMLQKFWSKDVIDEKTRALVMAVTGRQS